MNVYPLSPQTVGVLSVEAVRPFSITYHLKSHQSRSQWAINKILYVSISPWNSYAKQKSFSSLRSLHVCAAWSNKKHPEQKWKAPAVCDFCRCHQMGVHNLLVCHSWIPPRKITSLRSIRSDYGYRHAASKLDETSERDRKWFSAVWLAKLLSFAAALRNYDYDLINIWRETLELFNTTLYSVSFTTLVFETLVRMH